MTVTLHQFAYSHFNEKARWALAVKAVPYTRETYLPGPHMPAIRKISGRTTTPVLQLDSEYISGSAEIIDRLEKDYPEPALYPAAGALRDQAMTLQREFDADLGPSVRTVIFSALVNEGGYLCHMFGGSKGLLKRMAYRASFPLARSLIAKVNGVTPENVTRCITGTHEWLDRIADQAGATGYLVGDAFSVADLTAAALLAPIASVSHPDMKRPEPVPDSVQRLVQQFADHAALTWVHGIYEKHRP